MRRGRPETNTQLLERHLAALLLDAAFGRRMLAQALERAGLAAVPDDADALLSFCQSDLLFQLTLIAEAGRVSSFLRDVQRDLEASLGSDATVEGAPSCAPQPSGAIGISAPPIVEDSDEPPALTVVLVDEDAVRREEVARVLTDARSRVLAATATIDDLLELNLDRAHVLVCDLDAKRGVFSLLKLMERYPTLVVVARAEAPDLAKVTLKLAGARNHSIVSPAATPIGLASSVLSLCHGIRLALR